MSLHYIPRVTQLDAVHLDEQVEELLRQQIFSAFKYFKPGVLQTILPELELLIQTWIFKYSVYDNKCTFGHQMLSLKYKPDNFSKSKLYWYYGYTIGLKYLKQRALYNFTSNVTIQNIINRIEKFQLLSDILIFLRFIQSGRYPILIDLILDLQLTADKITREDLTDFSWTRELLWHNLIELIGTTMNILNIFGLRRQLINIFKQVWPKKNVRHGEMHSIPVMTLQTLCAFCSNKPILPYTMNCSHIFCYYCLLANKTADQNFACPKCNYIGKECNKLILSL